MLDWIRNVCTIAMKSFAVALDGDLLGSRSIPFLELETSPIDYASMAGSLRSESLPSAGE
jgi:hypothetical protein